MLTNMKADPVTKARILREMQGATAPVSVRWLVDVTEASEPEVIAAIFELDRERAGALSVEVGELWFKRA